jgi:arginase
VKRPIAVVGAPSNLGIRPYDDGEPRSLNRAPEVLRRRNLIARLGATDFGDVVPPAYRDFERPPKRPRHEAELMQYSRAVARRVAAAMGSGRFAVVLGGDCSVALGCLLGARRRAGGPIGLAYVDAHADFSTPSDSMTGSVSSMCLSLVSGRGDTPLAQLAGIVPLVAADHTALVGRRHAAAAPTMAALEASAILDVPSAVLSTGQNSQPIAAILSRVAGPSVRGFWIHLDVDVLNPAVMSAVDSPEAGGLTPEELEQVLAPLVHHPSALGLDISIYDPALDADRSCARLLVNLLDRVLQ